MPSFEIALNGEPPVTFGGRDLDILTVGVISILEEQKAHLLITSMDNTSAACHILCNKQLEPGEYLVVKFHREGTPGESSVEDVPYEIAAAVNATARTTTRAGLVVRLNGAGLMSGHVDDESTLHVAANWIKSRNRCLLEMACIRMTDAGQNQMIFEHEIISGQPFSIRVV